MTELIGDLASALLLYHLFYQYVTIEAKLLRNRHQGGKSKQVRVRSLNEFPLSGASRQPRAVRVTSLTRLATDKSCSALEIPAFAQPEASTRKRHAWASRAPQCSDHRSNRESLAPCSRGKNPKIAAGRTYAIGSLQDAGDDGRSIFLAKNRACIVIGIRAHVQHGPDDDCSGEQILPGRYSALWSVIGDLRASG